METEMLQESVESVTQYVDPAGFYLQPPNEQHRLETLGISISGLGKDAIVRIEEIGFDAWLDEAKDIAPPKYLAFSDTVEVPKERPIRKCLCAKCGGVFLSHTRATKKCPDCGGANDILQKNGKQLRACASGMDCLRAGKHTPAEAAPRSQYCSPNCRASHKARLERAKGKA
jgi:hypothetical protein